MFTYDTYLFDSNEMHKQTEENGNHIGQIKKVKMSYLSVFSYLDCFQNRNATIKKSDFYLIKYAINLCVCRRSDIEQKIINQNVLQTFFVNR